MLLFEHIYKQYGHTEALYDFSMRVEDGAVYGFVGPKNAGKSTALRLAAGLEYPDKGRVMVDDMEAGAQLRRLKRRIGYAPESNGRYANMRLSEYMDFFASCYEWDPAKAKRRVSVLLELVGLGSRQEQYMDALSAGALQKLSLARALLQDPKHLILDEPLKSMDPDMKSDYIQTLLELADSGKTILISSDKLTELSELCTAIGIINQGQMVLEGSMENVLEEVNAKNPIILTTAGNLSNALETLKTDKLVRSISIRGNELLIYYRGKAKEEAELLKRLIEQRVPIRSFHREKGNLEALLLQLTGQREERSVVRYEAESDFS